MENTIAAAARLAKANEIVLSTGNLKLRPTEKVKFLIWSLPARESCPYATEHCSTFCYAVKAERCYKTAREARARNMERSKRADFAPAMIETIRAYMSAPQYANAAFVFVRIHESGDFYSQEYTDAWLEIARACADIKNLRFVAYTKSAPFFVGREIPANMSVIGSIWDDTTPEQRALIESLFPATYTALRANEFTPEFSKCRCEDCATCQKCFHSKVARIACEIH